MTSNLVRGFVLPLLFDCRDLHIIVYCEAVRSDMLATAWLLVKIFAPFRVRLSEIGQCADRYYQYLVLPM